MEWDDPCEIEVSLPPLPSPNFSFYSEIFWKMFSKFFCMLGRKKKHGVEREIVCGLYFFLYSFLLKIYVWAQILCVYYKKVRLTCVLCAEMWWFLLLQTTNFIQCLVKVVNLLIRCRGFNLLEHNLIDDSHRWYFCVHSRRENRLWVN
jgi:hypothetical protein